MGRKRIAKRATILVAVVIASSFGFIVPSQMGTAFADDCSDTGYYFVGKYSQGTQAVRPEGSAITLLNVPEYVLCVGDTSANNTISSWTMTTANGSAPGFAQTGLLYRWGYSDCVKRFAGIDNGLGTYHEYFLGGCAGQNLSKRYTVKSVYDNGWHFQNIVGTTLLHTSVFSPFSLAQPLQTQNMSETHHKVSSVPGTPSLKNRFDGTMIQRFDDNTLM